MNTKPMAESDGKMTTEEPSEGPCPKCRQKQVVYQTWESSCGGYTDYKMRCKACGHMWWVEGSDA